MVKHEIIVDCASNKILKIQVSDLAQAQTFSISNKEKYTLSQVENVETTALQPANSQYCAGKCVYDSNCFTFVFH